jgi:hypothetical protein
MSDQISTPVTPANPAQPLAVFGSLENSVRDLTKRLDLMLARDPEKEFGQAEGNVGVAMEADSYQVLDAQLIPASDGTGGIVFNAEAVSQIYVKKIRIQQNIALVSNAFSNVNLGSIGILMEFFKSLRGNGNGFGNVPDASKIVLPTILGAVAESFVVATGVQTWQQQLIYDDILPLKYRYVRASYYSLITRAKTNLPLSTIYGAQVTFASQLQIQFFGE